LKLKHRKYFPIEEIKQLSNFASYFGAEQWLAIKFNGRSWTFVNPEDLVQAKNSYVFTVEDIERKGVSFNQLIE
jgi:Holliday junction resolvase